MEQKPGNETSEFSLTKLVILAGLSLDIIAIALEGIGSLGVNFGWIPPVMVVVGTLSMLVAKLGYTRSRTLVKLQAQVPQLVTEVSGTLPLAKDTGALVRQVVQEELERLTKPNSKVALGAAPEAITQPQQR